MLIVARALAVLSILSTLAAIEIIGCAIPADRLRSQGGIWRLFLFACVSECRFGSRDWDRACALRNFSCIVVLCGISLLGLVTLLAAGSNCSAAIDRKSVG